MILNKYDELTESFGIFPLHLLQALLPLLAYSTQNFPSDILIIGKLQRSFVQF